jgi:alpha/beta superfamily hydrolase
MISHEASRPLKVQADGLALEARLHTARGNAGAVVAPPHPLYGGSMTNPVVEITVEALLETGVSALAFNFRGTEASEGVATSSLEASTADYGAVLTALRAEVSGPIIAAGYSFGAGTALLGVRDEPSVLGLILIAPPLGMLRSEDLAAFKGKVLLVIGDDDDYTPIPELRELLTDAPNVKLEVLPGVDHFFHFGGLPALFTLLKDELATWLKSPL